MNEIKQQHAYKVGIILFGMMALLSMMLWFVSVNHSSALLSTLAEQAVLRFMVGFLFLFLLIRFGYGHLFRWRWNKDIAIILIPAVLVALNNLPISAIVNGRTAIHASSIELLAFVVDVFSTGWFEEIIFRSMILVVIMQYMEQTKKGLFMGIVISSVIFGVLHIANVFQGAAIPATLQQVLYSTLTGMLFSSVFLLTKNIWVTMLVHIVYNITGSIFVVTGVVLFQWDAITIIVTIVVALFATAFYIRELFYVNINEVFKFVTP
jgi:membrane protease YdiL (CAAX protease family)